MFSHYEHFLIRERFGLAQNLVRNSHFAEIVQKSTAGYHTDLFNRQS